MLPYPIAIVDLETTGMSPARERVIEVGICLAEGGAVVEEWSTLVNPDTPIPPFIERHTGISTAMVTHAPPFGEIAGAVARRLEGRVVVAHNAAFDVGFLKSEFRRAGHCFAAHALCTVRLSRALYPKERRHGLDALIERFGLPCANRHRALDDARALWHLLGAFREETGEARFFAAAGQVLRRHLPERESGGSG